jgi:hypothetical protein
MSDAVHKCAKRVFSKQPALSQKLCGIDCCHYIEKDRLFEDPMHACAAYGINLQRAAAPAAEHFGAE